MLAVAGDINRAGYFALEMWGGATFDSCLRYLNEDPWNRIVRLKEQIPDTPFMMLLRGQNLLGYKHYPDDAVQAFTAAAVKHGIDIVRIFDALNDTRNMALSMRATKEAGGHVQACVVYTISPVHDVAHYVETALELEELGADSICIKDMAGLLSPYDGFELVGQLKEEVGLPIEVHSHYTSGMAGMTYVKCVEAGADVIDCALSALALGTSQPATETMVAVFQGTPFDTGMDLELLTSINRHFKQVKSKYKDFLAPSLVDTEVLSYQIPGGMLSNLRSQLTAQGMLDKLDQVLEEVPRVREEMGYPPLVTPMSQIVGTQAVFNVATGERYKIKSKEIKDYVRGLYGRPPGEIDESVRKMIIGDEEVVTERPANLLPPRLESAREEVKEYIRKPEDVLSYVLFPEQALGFFRHRDQNAD